ncbi:Programmed_cell_death_protein_2 (plasmid) [Leishmania braziliensis MHOM/BR/75/M2904]|uniref:Programmed_cell_death_protein_2 n=1 Tax=Leishmania braziliensis MHOM/BR/75/M2904 TaxID=420245 RepID=A0A3P3Z6F4_LEIBR|nr:Programmed cell death protein 2 [Leishmania braziliensis]SYZ65722.1 Programmed_cell_death_protein_2 [Leishmania braziliensis MHOM/BR/75/M2904]
MSHKRDQLTSETKIGGTPTYFPPFSDADKTQIRRWTSCGVCGHAMSMLVQAYSPLPTAPATHPHHRMVYVFACNSGYCASQPTSSMVAFSVQVDQEDEQALSENAGEEEDEVIETGPLLPSELPEAVLPPCYVYIDAEPSKEVVVPTDIERELIKMAEKNTRSTVTDEELQQLEQTMDLKDKKMDYYYEKFRSRVARAPNQVLRYYQRTVAAAEATSALSRAKDVRPIFMNPDKVKAMVTIPACACCGSAQTAELQVMPTALYYLHVSEYTALARAGAAVKQVPLSSTGASTTVDTVRGASASSGATTGTEQTMTANVDDGCDFGTITVYVCGKDCAARQHGVVLRRETLCVEEAPTMRDEERAEKADAAQAGTDGATRKVTLRELLHGKEESDDGDEAVTTA